MRAPGTANELQYRRRLATQRVAAGYSPQVAPDFFGVDAWTLRRWLADFSARPVCGDEEALDRARPMRRTCLGIRQFKV